MKMTKDKSIMLRNIRGCFPTSMPLWPPISVERKGTVILNDVSIDSTAFHWYATVCAYRNIVPSQEKYSRANALLINPKKHKAPDKPLLNEHVSKRLKSEILEPKVMLQRIDVEVNANMSNEASSKTSKVLQIQPQNYPVSMSFILDSFDPLFSLLWAGIWKQLEVFKL